MNKILIIENDKRSAGKIAEELKSKLVDLEIHICLNGYDGLKYLNGKSCDLVIAESHLSDMKGLELLKRMADLGGCWPTIIVSQSGAGDEAVNFMRIGIYDYIVKDNNYPSSLPSAVQRALDLSYIFKERRHIVESSIKQEFGKEIARLARVFSHEVNNSLMTIICNTQLLLAKENIKDDELREKLRAIEDAAGRISRVSAVLTEYDNSGSSQSSAERTKKKISV